MEHTIKETTRLLLQGKLTKDEADKILLDLYNVSGRSEQLCRTFFPDGKTTSATKCQFCGKEKWSIKAQLPLTSRYQHYQIFI